MADRFPFTYTETTDPFTKKSDGLLKQCSATKTCPKIIQTDSEYEWWGSRASLVVTDPSGKALKLPDNVRIYLTTGTPHSARHDTVSALSKTCVMPLNPLHQGPVLRALLRNLDDWVVRGTAPPDSRTPSLADGSLVGGSKKQLATAIPGVPYTGMHVPASAEDLTTLPSRILGEYKVYVPRIDADGNVVGGIRLPVHAVPKATYTGWNPRSEGYGTTSLCTLQGGAVAFAETKEERMKNNDPRLSVQERYASAADYVAKVDAAAKKLVSERLMLEEDAQRSHQAAVDDTLAKIHANSAAAKAQ
jgi:Alpha/beta hydrolase domain